MPLGHPVPTTSAYLWSSPFSVSVRALAQQAASCYPRQFSIRIVPNHQSLPTPLGLKLLPLFECAERNVTTPCMSLDSTNYEFRTLENILKNCKTFLKKTKTNKQPIQGALCYLGGHLCATSAEGHKIHIFCLKK